MPTRPNNTATLIAGYSAEFFRNRSEVVQTVESLDIEPEAAQYLIDYPKSSTAGTTLLCRQIYDIATASREASPIQRQQVGRIGGLMLLLTDIVDSQVDRPDIALHEREGYLDAGLAVLLHGDRAKPDPPAKNRAQRISFALARTLHETVVQKDEEGYFATVFESLVPSVNRQLSSTDPTEQLKLAQEVGGLCALLGVASTEYATRTTHPEARIAAASIGAYAECLDHAYEMREDIMQGIPTYATLYLREHGDTPANRNKAKEDLLDAGSDSYKEGLEALDREQRPVYRATCRMLEVRYRFIKNLSDRIKF
ncbi:MAG TPA: hypothetical protein VLG92_03830 [Candidatus Saccharimonadia bacterium]|nr:hypothetical protein [Candidatus Saccharimonadia bacterium]